MGGHGTSASISREGPFLKPPILVSDGEGCAKFDFPSTASKPKQAPPHALTRCRRNAILSLYHLRPVPADLDGRPDDVRQQAGAPLPSLWLDENKPGMYPAAAELRQLGFRSRDTTLAMLNQCKPAPPCPTG